MKKILAFVSIFAVLTIIPLGSYAQNEDSTQTKADTTPNPFPVRNFTPENLKDHWAVGVTSLNEISTALSARYWPNETEAWDFDFGGYGTNRMNWAFGAGLGYRQNFQRPVEDVLTQWAFRINYSVRPNPVSPNSEINTINFFAGPGFEAFIPFWKNLSVEAFVGMNLNYLPDSNQFTVNVGGDNFSVFDAAVHFYFDEK